MFEVWLALGCHPREYLGVVKLELERDYVILPCCLIQVDLQMVAVFLSMSQRREYPSGFYPRFLLPWLWMCERMILLLLN